MTYGIDRGSDCAHRALQPLGELDLPHKEDGVAIVRAVVGLSSSLGITTTAEGVATNEQLASLATEGLNEFQGFVFSEPQRATDVARILSAQVQRAEAVA